MLSVREAREEDVGQIRAIFLAVYGHSYPHHELYDELWLKRAVFNDDALILVAEDEESGDVVGTASVLFDFGAQSDLVGEFGRLAVHPHYRRQHVGRLLMERRLEAVRDRLHVGLVVGRSVHPFAQRISLAQGFLPVGFLPLRHTFEHRESFSLLAKYFGDALTLRRNNPRVVPEVYPLTHLVMRQFPFAADPIIDEESAPYPAGGEFAVEELRSEGYPALLRIERGRVRHREIFGPVRLDYGFFKLRARAMDYLVARDGEQIVGAIGFTHDALEQTIRVIELITSSEHAIRFLLAELERRGRETWGTKYVEIDVSAYAPRMQRTLIELQFLPAAYVPAMVFHEVERLDIIKMVRIPVLEDLGLLALEPAMQGVADLVMRGFAQRAVAPRMAQAIREVPLFAGMTEEQATRLAGMGAVHSLAAGEPVFAETQRADSLHLVLKGEVRISHGPAADVVGVVGEGETLGELSLLTEKPHSASATAATEVDLGVVTHADLTDLIRRRPDIGVIIYRNLARGLGRKLQRTSWPQGDVDLT